MISTLLAACAVYILFLAIHWIPFRLVEIKKRTRTMTLILIICLAPIGIFYHFFADHISVAIDNGPVAGAVFYLACFTLLWCGYVQFVFSFDTSPSLRVLVVIRRMNASVAKSEVVRIMNFPDTFQRRFRRSVDGGAIIEKTTPGADSLYSLKPGKIVMVARVGKAAKNLFRLGAGG